MPTIEKIAEFVLSNDMIRITRQMVSGNYTQAEIDMAFRIKELQLLERMGEK